MQKNESQHQRSRNRKKIRTNCEKSSRISGTTPSGCACAHPPEESLPIGGRHEKDKVKKIRTGCEQSARISGTTPSGCACAHPPEESLPIEGWHEKDKVKKIRADCKQ